MMPVLEGFLSAHFLLSVFLYLVSLSVNSVYTCITTVLESSSSNQFFVKNSEGCHEVTNQ